MQSSYSSGGAPPPPPPRPGSGASYQYQGQSGGYGYPQNQYFNNNNNTPPQPQWSIQPPPSGDSHQQWQTSVPPRPPASYTQSSYNPGTYGPMPGAQASPISPMHYQVANLAPHGDTSSWGVKYNRNQYNQYAEEPKPPLPPRPGSSGQSAPGNHTQGTHQNSQYQYPAGTEAYAGSSGPDSQNVWAYDSRINHDTSPVPPPPPPLPLGYQNETQQQHNQNWSQQPQYSHDPPSHHYDPQSQEQQHPGYSQNQSYGNPMFGYHNQNSGDVTSAAYNQGTQQAISPIEQGSSFQWGTNTSDTKPSYVSPPDPTHAVLAMPNDTGTIDTSQQRPDFDSQGQPHPVSRPNSAFQGASSQEVVSTASALGFGGPSDWEHFSPAGEGPQDQFGSLPSPEKPNDSSAAVAELPSQPASVAAPEISPPSQNSKDTADTGSVAPTTLQLRQSTPVQKQPLADAPSLQNQQTGPPTRTDSTTSSQVSEIGRTETIDGVIQSWAATQPRTESGKEERKVGEATAQVTANESQVQSSPTPREHKPNHGIDEHAPKKETHFVDPYGDLEPEYKASLARFVAMLRKESLAVTDEEKYGVFKSFLKREMKLREILYGIDTSLLGPVQQTAVATMSNSEGQTRDISDGNAATPSTAPEGGRSLEPVSKPTATNVQTHKLNTSVAENQHSAEVDVSDGAEYSPGGRPLISRPGPTGQGKRSTTHRSLSLKATPHSSNTTTNVATMSPGADLPIVVEPDNGQLRSSSVPPVAPKDSAPFPPPRVEPPRPVYTPFRYTEGPQRGSEKLDIRPPSFQPYSGMRQQSADSGRSMARTSSTRVPRRRELHDGPTSPAAARRQHEEIFFGMIRDKGSEPAYAENSTKENGPESQPEGTQEQKQAKESPSGAIEALKALLPSVPFSGKTENAQLSDARHAVELFPDEFGFIRETVIEWDNGYKAERARLEYERHQRQEESEQHIDALFNENEIGYSDIGGLEDSFRREEAEKKLLEDRRELEDFKTKVYKVVDDKIKGEIEELEKKYNDALTLLENATAGQRMLETNSESAHISQVMQLSLTMFRKLEIRHQKRVEADLERERRRRKLELALWYSLGDVGATKNLADEFEAEERLTLHKAAVEKDERANKLMDKFDRAIIRGLGDNQRLSESILERTKEIKRDVIDGRITQSDALSDLLTSAIKILDVLMINSEACLQSFDIADKLLNEADYDVSVANVKLDNGGAATLRKLEEEKSIEDAKLQEDLTERLGMVRKLPGEAKSLVSDIFNSLRDGGGHVSSSPIVEASDDAEKQERLKKALEEAKRRNAAKA